MQEKDAERCAPFSMIMKRGRRVCIHEAVGATNLKVKYLMAAELKRIGLSDEAISRQLNISAKGA